MPYQDDCETNPCVACPSCGHKINLPPIEVEERVICGNCEHIVLIKVSDEGDRSFNAPDPRHLC